jgi:hypothetical protein
MKILLPRKRHSNGNDQSAQNGRAPVDSKPPPLDLEEGYPPAKTSVKRRTSQLCYESWSWRCGVASDVQRLVPLSNSVGVCNVTSRLA